MNALIDDARLTDLSSANVNLLADLAVLRANEGEELGDFVTRMTEEFEKAPVNDVDTEIMIPAIPYSCLELTTSTAASLAAVNKFKDDIQKGLNFGAWLSEQLGESCMKPTMIAQDLIDSETKRVDEAMARQTEKLED